MDPRWVDALVELWTKDLPIDFAAVEDKWALKPLQAAGCPPGCPLDQARSTLLCCITGFNDCKPHRGRSVQGLLG